jgi:hypothetical protein
MTPPATGSTTTSFANKADKPTAQAMSEKPLAVQNAGSDPSTSTTTSKQSTGGFKPEVQQH